MKANYIEIEARPDLSPAKVNVTAGGDGLGRDDEDMQVFINVFLNLGQAKELRKHLDDAIAACDRPRAKGRIEIRS